MLALGPISAGFSLGASVARSAALRLRVKAHQLSDAALTFVENVEPEPLRPAAPRRWLRGVTRIETPFRYHAGRRPGRIKPIEFVVMHYTASPWSSRTPSGADPERIRRWAEGRGRESSTHFVILRDGRIFQLAPLTDRTWHVTSKWPWPGDGRGHINDRSIGVDYECVGWLQEGSNGRLVNAYGGRPGPHAFDANGKPWEKPTTAQVVAGRRLFKMLGEALPVLRDGAPHRLIGHTQAQPTRPDPGPLWPMDEMRAAMRGDA